MRDRTVELFGDRLALGEEVSQLGGFSGSLIEDRVTDSLLPGGGVLPAGSKEDMLRLMSGGARRKSRKTHKSRRGGRRKSHSARNTFRISFRGQIRLKQRHRQ